MLVAPMATPLASADSKTSARSSPDFGVTSFTLDGAGSVQDGANIYVENATHTARIVVSNTGSASGSVVVSLYHQGSSSSTKTLVSSFGPVTIAPGTSHTPIGISWTASPGNGQKLFAETFSLADPNSGNNENVISFLNTFPREIGLEGQIDRDTQFEKSFLLPLQIITSVIGWETERKANLDFLFA